MKANNITKTALSAICAAGVLMAVGSARATTINSAQYFALVNPGAPSDMADDTAELNDILVNTTYGYPKGPGTWSTGDVPSWGSGKDAYMITIEDLGSLPSSAATYATGASQGGTSFTLDLNGNTYDYLMVKWNGTDVFYNIHGITGPLQVVNDLVSNNQGVKQNASGYKLFNQNSVPDGGLTVALLGSALVGIGFLRRKFTRS